MTYDFEEHKTLIRDLYLGQNKTLREVKQILSSLYGFNPEYLPLPSGKACASLWKVNFSQGPLLAEPSSYLGISEERSSS